MTLEGGKPLIENSDEIGWTAAAFDYYAEIGRDSAGRVIPSIEATPARAGGQGPGRRRRLHRALELPAAAARVEARPGAGRGQRDRLQAVGGDAALDPRRRRLLRPPAGRRRQPGRRRRRRRRGDRRRRAGRRASPSPARSRPASGSPPSAPSGSPGSTSRWAARTRSSSAPTSPTRSRSPPAAAPGPRSSTPARSAPRPSASTSIDDVYDDYLRGVRRPHPLARRRRPARPGDRRRPDGLGGPAGEGRRPGRGRRRRRRRGGRRRRRRPATSAATSSPRRWSPGRRRETDLLREETFGPVAPLVPVRLARRGDRARQLDPLRPRRQHLHRGPARRCCAACARSRRGRSGSTTR